MERLRKHLTKEEKKMHKRRVHWEKQKEAEKKKKQEESKLKEPELVSVPKNPLLFLANVEVPRKLVPIEHHDLSQLPEESKKILERTYCNMVY
jgi:hypothetical protein